MYLVIVLVIAIANALDDHGNAELVVVVGLAGHVALSSYWVPRLRRDAQGVDEFVQIGRDLQLSEEDVLRLVVKLNVALDSAELIGGRLERKVGLEGAHPGHAILGHGVAAFGALTVGDEPESVDEGGTAHVLAILEDGDLKQD